MRNIVLCFIIILLFDPAFGQVSVYDCNVFNPQVSQLEVEGSGLDFERPCIEFTDGNYDFNPPIEKNVIAQNHISFTDGFHAHQMDPASFMHFKIGEVPLHDVVVLNYSDLNSVLRYKKVEFGIEIQGELLARINKFLDSNYLTNFTSVNPFLDRELNIKATFTNLNTGEVKTRYGFYYQDYERNESENDWDFTAQNNYPMRIRFAPPQNGKWDVKILITFLQDPLNMTYSSEELPKFSFNVIESGHPGYVKVHNNNKNLQRGNRVIMPIGHAFPGPYNRTKIWSAHPDSTNKAADLLAWKNYHKDIDSFIHLGGKYIKTAETAYGNLIEFEKLGDYSGRLHYAWEEDKLLDSCEKYDVLIDFNLLFQDVIMTYGQNGDGNVFGSGFSPERWDYGPYGPDGNINPEDIAYGFPTYCYYRPGEYPVDMFTDNELMYFHKQRNRYYESRLGYSPQIFVYELVSEPWWLNKHTNHTPGTDNSFDDSPAVYAALENYHVKMSDYLKDSLQSEHLIMMNQFTIEGIWQDVFNIGAAGHHNIDMIGTSYYSDLPNKLVDQKNDSDNNEITFGEDSQRRNVNKIHNDFNKPVFYTELGHWGGIACNGDKMSTVDVMTCGFTGVSGFIVWSGYGNDEGGHYKYVNGKPDERKVWASTIYSEKFMNSDFVSSLLHTWDGNWKHGVQIEKSSNYNGNDFDKEMQYFISQDGTKCVGYVKNRRFNLVTQSDTCDNTPPFNSVVYDFWEEFKIKNGPKKFEIHELNSSNCYEMTWRKYKTGIKDTIENIDSKNNGKLKIKSDLLLDLVNPIYWFTLEEMGCEKKMDQEGTESKASDLQIVTFKIYPNPSHESSVLNTSIDDILYLYDVNNQNIDAIVVKKGENIIESSHYSPGVYFLFSNTSKHVEKWVII